MNKRAAEILIIILSSDSIQNIVSLSGLYNVSSRTIYNDLDEINYYLNDNGYQKLNLKSGDIFYEIDTLTKENIKDINNDLQHFISIEKYYNSKDRINYGIFLLLISPITTTTLLSQELDVSISTIKKDIKLIENKVNLFDLKFISQRFKGVSITGDEVNIRDILVEIILNDYEVDHYYEIDEFYRDYIDEELLTITQTIIDGIANDLKIQYVDTHYLYILISTYVCLKRLSSKKTITESNSQSYAHNESKGKLFKVVKKRIINELSGKDIINNAFHINDLEIYYVVNKIQSASHHGTGEIFHKNWLNIQFIVNRLIKNVEDETLIINSKDNRLHQELIQHLRPTINRLTKGLSFNNPLKSQTFEKYGELYESIKKHIKIVESFYNVKFSQDELGYIVLLFASSYERNKKIIKIIPTVVIVCEKGISTSSILRSQIEQQFEVNVLKVFSRNKFFEYLDRTETREFDFVISTIQLKVDEKYLKVNPILTTIDLLNLSSMFTTYSYNGSVTKIINKISPFIEIKDLKKLERTLLETLGKKENLEVFERRELMLKDVINENLIELQQEVSDSFGAVKFAGNLLRQEKLIEESYIEAMVENLREHGPYFVIAPGIAMPHARPEAGVNEVGISIVTLRTPVVFGHEKNDPVRLIIGLCAVDQQTHLTALTELMEILADSEKLDKIMHSTNKNDVLKLLKEEN